MEQLLLDYWWVWTLFIIVIIGIGINRFQPKEPKAMVIITPHAVDRAKEDNCEAEMFKIADLIRQWNINDNMRKTVQWRGSNVKAIVCGKNNFDEEASEIARRSGAGPLPYVAIMTVYRDMNIGEDGGPPTHGRGNITRSRSR